MPIYEFYCPDCDTLFSFFSARIDTAARPACPRCRRSALERRPARFAALTRGTAAAGEGAAGDEDDAFAGLGVDEERLGAAFETAMAEAGAAGGDEDDPRQVARMFRRIGEVAGLEPGPQMEEMLRRLEAGEDPERLEDDMDAGGEDEGAGGDPLAELFRKKRQPRRWRPRVDEELYFL